MNATQTQTKKLSLKRGLTIGMAAIAVTSLAGGYSLGATHAFGTASAHDMNGSSWNSKDDNSAAVAYITDAVETYLAKQGMDPDMSQISHVQVSGHYAIGMIENGDSPSVFFAQKVNGKWDVQYSGQAVPSNVNQNLKGAGFPSDWADNSQGMFKDDN
jgi:hypothetical protein